MEFEIGIVGGGPAGLCALHGAAGADILLVDAGKDLAERDRFDAYDNTTGIGGSGLYSDGKFSFFPSATALWRLADRACLERAYVWTAALLRTRGMTVPEFPRTTEEVGAGTGTWTLKSYPSFYLGLRERMDLTKSLAETAKAEIRTRTRVERIRRLADGGFELSLGCLGGGTPWSARVRSLILAGGRFGALMAGWDPPHPRKFRRLEFGVRIEQASPDAFFADLPQLDPKLRFADPGGTVEWRTFCACRDGEAVRTSTGGIWTVSGRADCPPTGRSNIGFNTRILSEELAKQIWAEMETPLRDATACFDVPAPGTDADAPEDMVNALGPSGSAQVLRGLRLLAEAYPTVQADGTRLVGPTLEGIGWYDFLDDTLRAPGAPLWIAGDAGGRFRGIVAAMISGHFAGAQARQALRRPDPAGDGGRETVAARAGGLAMR